MPKRPSQKIYVEQDGADFYIRTSPESEVFNVVSAPFKVRDFDLAAAEKARRWFKQTYATGTIDAIFA